MTGPAPGGALRPGATTQLEPSWAVAYGPASANVGGTRVTGSGQTYNGKTGQGTIVPLRVGVRQTLGGVVEASGDIGWLDSGVELRAGTPGGAGAFPVAVTAGFRSGRFAFNLGEKTYEGRLRFEVYPDLSRANDGSKRLMLAAGASTGTFAHSLTLPDSFQSQGGDAPDFDTASVIVVRPETRLELAIGFSLRGPRGGVTFALVPWILLHAGAPTKEVCSSCIGFPAPAATDFSQSWGAALVVSPSLAVDFIDWVSGGS
jgi:hypothetical protein